MMEFPPEHLKGKCKSCFGLKQSFITHANDSEKVICCSCGFTTTKQGLKILAKEKEIPKTRGSFLDHLIKIQRENNNDYDKR